MPLYENANARLARIREKTRKISNQNNKNNNNNRYYHIYSCVAQGCYTSDCKCENVGNVSFEYEAQSGESDSAPLTTTESMSMRMEVLKDSNVQVTSEGASPNVSIEQFLERRVAIYDTTWAVTNTLDVNFDPWQLFLNNTAVKKKLDNFHLIKGNLMLTFYINGTPFHQGLAFASYQYLNKNYIVGGINDGIICNLSQRPHIKLVPTTSQGGCLCVPFLYMHNFLDLQAATTLNASEIGDLRIRSVGALEQINSGTDSVSINVYAQMVDPMIAGATTKNVALSGKGSMGSIFDFEAQSGSKDEYADDGVISGPASTIAQYAGYLTKAPVIGPFALATQIGANAMGGIARLFGYSRPIIIKDISSMKNHVVSNLAICEGGDLSQKLTLTAKQELSVDPRLVGMPGDVDEMDLKFFTGKESYVTELSWSVGDSIGATIFAIQVNPMIENHGAHSGGYKYHPTSLSFISRMFSQWCGSLKFRFVSLSSAYHRGRIAAIYDPAGNIGTTDPYNTTFNTILDLQEARDFEVTVRWQNDRVWLDVEEDSEGNTYWTETNAQAVTPMTTSNGVLYLQVATELTVPDGTTDARFAVFVSAGDDFMLQNPSNTIARLSTFTPVAQSGEGELGAFGMFEAQGEDIEGAEDAAPKFSKDPIELTANVQSRVLERPFVCYGEVPTHLRQILKRFCYHVTLGGRATPESGEVFYTTNMAAMPLQPGYDPDGVHGTSKTPSTPYNFVAGTHIAYLKQAYALWKGAIRWKYIPTNTGSTGLMYVNRTTGGIMNTAVTYDFYSSYKRATNHLPSEVAHGYMSGRQCALSGAGITQAQTQTGLEVEIPYQLPVRGSLTTNGWQLTSGNSVGTGFPGGPTYDLFVLNENGDRMAIDTYVAAGEDFAFHGFIGAPTLYKADLPDPTT